MKICIVAEGCYPYGSGGVSSWIDSIIRAFPEQEFLVLAIVTDRQTPCRRFALSLPDNVTQVHEAYLQDKDWGSNGKHLEETAYAAVQSLVLGRDVDLDTLVHMFQTDSISINALLMGEDFLHIVRERYDREKTRPVFTDFLWSFRSLLLPMLTVLQTEVPRADCYHCLSTGYAGLLGCMGKILHGGAMLLSEHGIYTREREEEIIRAEWIKKECKGFWRRHFHLLAELAYQRADAVTSLFARARAVQIDCGCPREKTWVTPNGIDWKRLEGIRGKRPEDAGHINVGAFLRVTPVKDVMTLLQAFCCARAQMPELRLWIMGSRTEDPSYARECEEAADALGITDAVTFTGHIDTRDYLGRMDFTILTSISEGQPLTILESFAARKAVIATDVGNCRDMLYGNQDHFGPAGILLRMMHPVETARAILTLAREEETRTRMGENGCRRLRAFYTLERMKQAYRELYRRMESWRVSESTFSLSVRKES